MSVPDERGNAALIHARAVEWLLERRDNPDWSDTDQAELDAWLAQSPAHLLAYWRAEEGCRRTELLASVRPLSRDRVAQSSRKVRAIARWAATAAILAIGSFLGYVHYFGSADRVFSTPIGGYEAVALSDGSRIELNTDTLIRVRLDGHQRTIFLERGEAFFKVRHDPAHPFHVLAGDHVITDLGTKFAVRRNSEGIDISLLEGRVRLAKIDGTENSRQALLVAGERAVANSNSISITKAPAQELATALSWRRGVIVFHHTTLAQAAAELNRYNRTKVIIGDAQTAQLTMTGAFPTNDIAAFTVAAREVFGLSVDNGPDEIVITHPEH